MKIPSWMVEHIKRNIVFPKNLSLILNEMFGEDRWEFVPPPARKQIENAHAYFVRLNDNGD